jgi:deazaflavin-dependent oxidoreductase (nitroreductase family)
MIAGDRVPTGGLDRSGLTREAGTMATMTSTDHQAAFVEMTRALIADFRAHAGQVTSGPFAGRPVLLLTTTGAHSGQPRHAPLVYSRDGERWVIVASKGGAPSHPSWYLNLVAHPVVTVEVGGETFEARATAVEGAERDRLFAAHAAASPAFTSYQQRTSRVIPVVVLERIDEADQRTS